MGQDTPLGVQPDDWLLFCNNDLQGNRIAHQPDHRVSTTAAPPIPASAASASCTATTPSTPRSYGGIITSLASWTSGGHPLDIMVFEHNTGLNIPLGCDCTDQGMSTQMVNTLFYKNNFTLGTATYGGSMGIKFAAGQTPGMQQDTWTGFQTTYAGAPPGAVLELPLRTLTASTVLNGSSAQATLPVWNSGTTAMSWTATSTTATWLTLSPTSGTAPIEGSSSITLNCNPSGLAIGTYSALITITAGTLVKKATLTFNVTGGPQPTITSPANNANFSPGSNIPITATATDATGTVSNIDFYQNGTKIGTVTSSPWSYTWTSVATGGYTLTADRHRQQQQHRPLQRGLYHRGHRRRPARITSPANNAVFSAPANVTINASASSSGGTIARVQFYNGAQLLNTALTSPYSYTWSNVVSGFYALTAAAYDNLGAVTTSSAVNITVTAPPTVSLTAPTTGTYYSAPASIAMNATASSVTSTITQVAILRERHAARHRYRVAVQLHLERVPANTGYYALTAKAH